MKTRHVIHSRSASLLTAIVCLVLLSLLPARAEETAERRPTLPDREFKEQLRSLEQLRNNAAQDREIRSLLRNRWFSSVQVKTIARTIANEDARYEFALAAYPRTVDPENFYEVYDAFTSYSKVFRLHDRIRNTRPRETDFGHDRTQPVSDEAMAELVKSLRSESFDNTKLTVARQMLAGRPRFLSRQIAELLREFSFDNARLEIAKLGYDAVIDPGNYFLVNQTFTFDSNKQELARYIESHNRHPTPPGKD